MNIIIVGCGKVGSALAEQLSKEDNDVTIVDLNYELVQDLSSDLDIMGVVGSGSNHQILEEAGIEKADLLIAVTGSDELNLLSCLIAKKAGNCQTIARVRNPEYSRESSYIKEELGLAMVIMSLTLWPEDIRNRLAASGALIGVSFGSVLSVIYLAFNHFRTRRGSAARAADQPDRSRVVLARLLKLAIPITLSSCSMSLVTIIDTNLVNNQLQNVFTAIQGGMTGISNSFLDIFPKAVEIFQNNTDAWQQALLTDPATKLDPILDSARSLYGTYSKTMSVYNLPFNLMIPLTACIVPGISACLARSDRLGAKRITESAMRVAALIALPCGFGLLALGGPIMELIALGNVDTAIAGPILSILGIASIFVCFQLVGTAILQANGIVNLPIITVIIGGVTKILVNYTLVGNPKIMIFGAPVGTLSCFAVISILNLLIIKRCVPNPPRYLVALSKPLAASVVMAAAAWGSHGLLARVLNGSLTRDMAATAGAILVGVVVYVILVLALRTLTREDLEMMPGGKKLAKILHIQ